MQDRSVVASSSCRAFRVELRDGRGYWTVVDDEYVKVAVADRFLFDLRFGRDRAESTTRVYAGELARFLTWCAGTGRSLEDGARQLSRFVFLLRTTATERPGAGQGRPPGPARINHVLAVVREFFKHAVADGAVDGSVLAALYEVADDRFLPAELRPWGKRASLPGTAPPSAADLAACPARGRHASRVGGDARGCDLLAGPLLAGAVVVRGPEDRRVPGPAAV